MAPLIRMEVKTDAELFDLLKGTSRDDVCQSDVAEAIYWAFKTEQIDPNTFANIAVRALVNALIRAGRCRRDREGKVFMLPSH